MQQQSKACLISSHDNSFICLLCVDKNCTQQSRTLCQQCIMEPSYNHSTCKSFLEFRDQTGFNLRIRQKNNECNMQLMLENVISQEGKLCQKIEAEFEDFSEIILRRINEIKKEIKVKFLEKSSQLKEEIQNCVNSQDEFDNIQNIEQQMKLFKQNFISIQELNQQLVQKQQNDIAQASQNIQQRYKKFKNISFDIQQIAEERNQVLAILQNLKEISFGFEDFQEFQDNFDNMKQNNKKTLLNELIPMSKKTSLKKPDPSTYKVDTQCSVRSKMSFKKEEHINFKFKLKFSQNRNFFVGIAPKQLSERSFFNWGESSYISLSLPGLSNNFTNKGQAINTLFKDGQIYQLEVCIKENSFIISDAKKKSVVTYIKGLDQAYSDWILVFSVSPGQILQVL